MTRLTLLWPFLGLFASSCAQSKTPCTTPSVCASGEECLANRCVVLGSDPVARGSRRLVLMPEVMAVVSARGSAQVDALPNAVTFGSERDGAAALYLAFEIGSHKIQNVDSAFVLLEPLPMSAHEPAPIEVDGWRVAEPWERNAISWLAQPALAPPRARGIAQSSPHTVFRIDVSAIIRFWLRQPLHNRGLVLKASGGDGHGISFATGASDGIGPRLELYVR